MHVQSKYKASHQGKEGREELQKEGTDGISGQYKQ